MIVRANISTNIVDVSLDGANKTADFALSIRPSGNNQTSLSLNNSSQLSTGIRTYSLRRLDLSPGEYGLVQAQWGDVSLNVPVAFNAIGPTRYSTYNTPDSNHPTCSGPTQPAVLVDFVTTRQACHYGAITFFSPAIRTAELWLGRTRRAILDLSSLQESATGRSVLTRKGLSPARTMRLSGVRDTEMETEEPSAGDTEPVE